MALLADINDLLNKRKVESDRIEFKKGWNPTAIYRSICAFANDIEDIGGGYILVGVEAIDGMPEAMYQPPMPMPQPLNVTSGLHPR